jgi:DNA-binding transcriptional LysR family regulator
LGTTQPTVSKRIAALEEEFGCRMFLRSTRRLSPTPEAHRVYEKAQLILETFEDARAAARNQVAEASGTLSISLPSSAGRRILMPVIHDYLRVNTQVRLDIRLSERPTDIVGEGAEIAIRIGELADSSLRSRTLCRVPRIAVASPAYLSQRPAPVMPSDLGAHHCIAYAGFLETTTWVFEGETGRHAVQVAPDIKVDDAEGMLALALDGAGIATLPAWLVSSHLNEGRLERILPEYSCPSVPMSVLHQASFTPPLRVRNMLDHLYDKRQDIASLVSGGA